MTINNSILKTIDKEIGIVLSSTDDKSIVRFFTKILGKHKVYDLEDTEFIHRAIHIVICINKVDTIENSMKMAQYLHVPILILDTKPKPDFLRTKEMSEPQITHMQIATNEMIAHSWNIDSYHDIVDTDITNEKSLEKWKQILINLAQQTFTVNIEKPKPDKYNEEQPEKYSFNY